MKAASIKEIKSALSDLDPDSLTAVCLRLARFKKENKELITYLLFEASNEAAYLEGVKAELETLFGEIPDKNVYYVKKSLRKILRLMNRHIKYSDEVSSEIELRLFFCIQMKNAGIPLKQGSVLFNIYQQQLKKIETLLSKIPEDMRADYEPGLNKL